MEEKNNLQAVMFANRLRKKHKSLDKWAKRECVTAYRVYDRDIPEIPLTVDLYGFVDEEGKIIEKYAYVCLFERPYEKDPHQEDIWLDLMGKQVAEVLGIAREHVIIKKRRKQKGSDQYEKKQSRKPIKGVVREKSLKFYVNLSDYMDTGLFLDHRPLREMLVKTAKDARVLNLFGYTGSLSVASAVGGASYIQTVDLSNTYLNWARDNLELNHCTGDKQYAMIRSDVLAYLELEARKRGNPNGRGFDIILLDPPTFSNSSMTETVLDTNKDWPILVKGALALLNPGGILYFSTNSRRLAFHEESIPSSIHGHAVTIEDITVQTVPEDFKMHRIHRCWKISLSLE